MKKILEKFTAKKEKPEPQAESAVSEPGSSLPPQRKMDRFATVSWGLTFLLGISLLGGTLY